MLAIWEFLKGTLGFMGAVGFLYGGLTILVPTMIYFVLRSVINYYKEV